eukprot:EG_transcript_18373
MAPVSGVLPLPTPTLSRAAPASAKEPVDPSIRVCLDFLKGRCTRTWCKFHHPDLSQYQQLSGAVQVQAGRQVCEVWALTGQCKFGAKCSKVHPILMPQIAQPMITVVPVMFFPQFVSNPPMALRKDLSAAALPNPQAATQEYAASSGTPILTPERGHGWPATAARASDPAPAKPRRPRHVSLALPPLAADGSPMSPTLAKGPAQHTTEAMLQALGADGWERDMQLPSSLVSPTELQSSKSGESVTSSLGLDLVLRDLLGDFKVSSAC